MTDETTAPAPQDPETQPDVPGRDPEHPHGVPPGQHPDREPGAPADPGQPEPPGKPETPEPRVSQR